MEEWQKIQQEPAEEVHTASHVDWEHWYHFANELKIKAENQCKFYEEEIKMLHDRIARLKVALKNVALEMR